MELNVKSKKYNDADVLEVKDEEVKTALGKLGITGTKLYKHNLRFRTEQEKDIYIDIVSIRGTPYTDLSTINDKYYEVLSYGYVKPEDSPYQVIGIEDSGMDSFLINYVGGGQVEYVEVKDFVSDTVTDL